MINIKDTIKENKMLLGENRKNILDDNHFDFSIGIDEHFIVGGGCSVHQFVKITKK